MNLMLTGANVSIKVVQRVLGIFTDNAKYPIEALIHRQAGALADRLLQSRARAVDPYNDIESAVVGVLFEMCFGGCGVSVPGDEQLYAEMMRQLHGMRAVIPAVQAVDVMPWLAPFLRRPLQRYHHSLQRSHQLNTDKVIIVIIIIIISSSSSKNIRPRMALTMCIAQDNAIGHVRLSVSNLAFEPADL